MDEDRIGHAETEVGSADPAIAYKSTVLPGNPHDDPADQIIVATAREENAVVISKNERIRNCKDVKSVW